MNGEWQPIETAPRDGTKVLVFCSASKDDSRRVGIWTAVFLDNGNTADWYVGIIEWEMGFSFDEPPFSAPLMFDADKLTHWMPLPDPPKVTP